VLYVIHGPDSYSARKLVDSVMSQHAGDVEQDSPLWLDARTAGPQDVLNACGQVSLFGGTSRVVLEGLLSKFEPPKSGGARPQKRRNKSDAPVLGEWETFPSRAAALPDTSVLVLLDGELKGPNPLLKALQPVAEVNECKTLNAGQLQSWIQNRVAEAGGQFQPEAVRSLAMLSGGDLWQLSAEIEKLLLYADGRPVSAEMVDAAAAGTPTTTIFMLVDAIVEGKEQRARRCLDAMYRNGLSAGYLFTMVDRQLRLIAQAREGGGTRGMRRQPTGELARLRDFALRRVCEQADRYSETQVRHALERLVAADRAVKTGASGDRVALDLLITDLLPATARS